MKSIKEGPFIWERSRLLLLEELAGGSSTRSRHYSSSITITDAKDIWENVKMILEGSELTKDDRESQLYYIRCQVGILQVTTEARANLLMLSVKEDNGNMVHVTVKLYGPNTEYVINRHSELQAIYHLSAAGYGPKLQGTFRNGMVQSFIHARTLDVSDMSRPKMAAEIAKKLKEFHQVDVSGSKEPQLWTDILKFLKSASNLTFDDGEKQKLYMKILFEEVKAGISQLKELTGHLNAPVVFAHNDLLSGNLMMNDDERKVYFIDFEYGSYSYRGFDIGNHFNEYAGYDCDYKLYTCFLVF
ncbi:probable ethanolamine kinase [Tanacetum coccineum]